MLGAIVNIELWGLLLDFPLREWYLLLSQNFSLWGDKTFCGEVSEKFEKPMKKNSFVMRIIKSTNGIVVKYF